MTFSCVKCDFDSFFYIFGLAAALTAWILVLVDGKPTIPVIYAMEDPEVGPRVREIFESPATDYEQAEEAIELIKRTDSVDRCMDLARSYAERAKAAIADVPPSVYKDALLNIVDFIVSRDR